MFGEIAGELDLVDNTWVARRVWSNSDGMFEFKSWGDCVLWPGWSVLFVVRVLGFDSSTKLCVSTIHSFLFQYFIITIFARSQHYLPNNTMPKHSSISLARKWTGTLPPFFQHKIYFVSCSTVALFSRHVATSKDSNFPESSASRVDVRETVIKLLHLLEQCSRSQSARITSKSLQTRFVLPPLSSS